MKITINLSDTSKVSTSAAKKSKVFEEIQEALDAQEYTKFVKLASKLSDKAATDAIVDGLLCPSKWPAGIDYPARLAKLLISSKANESLTDLTNCFYSRGRSLDVEAYALLKADVLSDPKKAIMANSGGVTLKDSMPPNGLLAFAKAEKAFVRKMFLKLSEQDRKTLFSLNEFHEEWSDAAKAVGIKL